MAIKLRRLAEEDKPYVREKVFHKGVDFIITRGRKVIPLELDGFVAVDDNDIIVGCVTYEIIGDQCEIVTIDAFTKFSGIGTALLNKARGVAEERNCRRLWLITTNSNIDAIRFYQKRGMTIAAVHVSALELSRKLKPQIPHIGEYGIPMRDEIEFEIRLNRPTAGD